MIRVFILLTTFYFSTIATSGERIGIFTGTFDPPHIGHAQLLHAAAQEGSLDKVIVVPNFDAPHKPNATKIDHRMMMTYLAFADFDHIEVLSMQEFKLLQQLTRDKGPNELYKHFLRTLPKESQIFQISGSDIVNRYRKKVAAFEISDNRLQILLMERAGDEPLDLEFLGRYKQKYTVLQHHAVEMSSSGLRKTISKKQFMFNTIPGISPLVMNYILRHQLYSENPRCLDYLLSPEN